jgi:hypothetical protein
MHQEDLNDLINELNQLIRFKEMTDWGMQRKSGNFKEAAGPKLYVRGKTTWEFFDLQVSSPNSKFFNLYQEIMHARQRTSFHLLHNDFEEAKQWQKKTNNNSGPFGQKNPCWY